MPTPKTTDSHHSSPADAKRNAPGLRAMHALLPNPDAYSADRGGSQHPEKRRAGGHSVSLADVTEQQLLPTPRSADHTHSMTAPSAMRHVADGNGALAEVLGYHLLPTPKAGDADFGMPRTSGRPPERSTHLMTRMEYSKPAGSWGPYAAAIHRWEQVLGRTAPDPTETGPKGGRRLASRFVEWMMGLPEGWVTGVGLTRSQELKALGNGVVTQQAVYALSLMSGVYVKEENTYV